MEIEKDKGLIEMGIRLRNLDNKVLQTPESFKEEVKGRLNQRRGR